MEASAEQGPASRVDRLLGLAISPHLIVSVVLLTAAGIVAVAGRDLTLWVGVLAVAAGWSSAWSP
jgi:hypothetical protein